MEFTKEDREAYHKQVVEHYGDINSWKTDHLRHCNVLIHLTITEWEYEDDLYIAKWAKYYQNVDGCVVVYKKEIQSLLFEANKLSVLADKMEHVKGLEPDEKFLITKYLRGGCHKLLQEGKSLIDDGQNFKDENKSLMQYEIDNPPTYKKSVGRPSSKFLYQWMDYLVSELGTNQKAADYASDSPITDSKRTDTLLREHRKYRNAQGEG
jgi:hypothetical protein